MASPSERFKGFIDFLSMEFKNPLRGFLIRFLKESFIETVEMLEPEAIDVVREYVDKIRDDPNTPPEFRTMLGKLTAGTQPLPLLVLIPLAVLLLIPTVTSIVRPLGNLIEYSQEKIFHSFRLDPQSIITAWRRDPAKYESLFNDLRDLGWTEERIEALKFFTLHYPAPADLVNWQAKEVFEPDMVAKYGLRDELDGLQRDAFYKAGMSDEQIDNYWMAHWVHPEFRTVVEMLRRTDFSEDDLQNWFRLVEIPPFWRDKLIEISYEVPTRVDVRRFWDMRTIDEARLREIYAWQGYHGKDLDDYVLWTKVYVAFPDLISRWRNGWISLEEVRSELTGLGMPADRLEEMIQTKIKPEGPARTATEKDLTKSEIYKGVKKGVITWNEGIELLMDLGYDADEADYILTINAPADSVAVVIKQREVTKTEIRAGMKQGILSDPEALQRLIDLRYSPLDADFLMLIYKAAIDPSEAIRDREASKADIVLAVKKGLITPEDGFLMLIDIGFTDEASTFILTVRADSTPFSPMNYEEFKDQTNKWRKSSKAISSTEAEGIRKAAALVLVLTRDIESLTKAIKLEEYKLGERDILPKSATAARDKLRVKLHRAESKLDAARSDYNRLRAELRNS